MTRLTFLLVSFGGLLHAQGCNFINPTLTPNISLLLPSTNNSCNWGVYTNQTIMMLDSFLSGHSGVPAINFVPQTLFGNPISGLTLYVNPGDGLFHTRNSAGVDVVLTGSGGTGTVTHTLGALTLGQLILGNAGADIKTGDLSGDVSTSGSSATALAIVNSNVGMCGDATHVSQITLDAKGRATSCTPVLITGTGGITQLTGDAAAGPGSGSQPLILATVNGNVGTFGDSTHVARLTVDAKGRITAVTLVAIAGGGGAATSIQGGPLSGLPGTCTASDVYFATDQPRGEQLYQCSSTNTFTQTFLHDSTIVNTAGAFGVDLNQFCRFTNSCPIAALWNFDIGQDFTEHASGTTPASSHLHIYANTDHTFHQVTSGGVDTPLSGGGVTAHWVSATNTTGLTIPGSLTPTPLTYDTNDAATTNPALHSTSSNPQNFGADATGLWAGSCEVTSNAGSIDMQVAIKVNGTFSFRGGYPGFVSTGGEVSVNVPWSVHLTSGDIVTCLGISNSGFTTEPLIATAFYMYLVH